MPASARVVTAVVVAAILSVGSVWGAPIATADQTSTVNVPIARLEGRGHGHGVGMSQWGAFTMANEGRNAADILATFYPGTELGTAGGNVVVAIEQGDRVRVHFPTGGEIRSSFEGPQHAGFPVRVGAGGTVDLIRESDGYRVEGGQVSGLSTGATPYGTSSSRNTAQSDCVLVVCPPDDGGGDDGGDGSTTTTTRPTPLPGPTAPTPTQPPPSGGGDDTTTTTRPPEARSPTPLWAVAAGGGPVHSVGRARSYRGVFEYAGPQGGARLRNHVDVESYLKGMAEVPGSWPPAAVQAQAIAARTFALRAMAGGGEICDSESCQVYTGISHESAGQAAAVDATRGIVVRHGGRLAATFYSASGGGHSATITEGFGTPGDVSYLQAKPYSTSNPKAWEIDIALADVAARLGYPGTVEDVRVDRTGPSGRALAMTLDGDQGPMTIDPHDFRRKLGLQSNLFTVTTTETDEAPPPPPTEPVTDVVGAAPDTTRGQSSILAPVRRTSQAPQAFAAAPAPERAPPVALVAVATLLIGLTVIAGTTHVGSSRRLHPVFAAVTTVADVARMRAGSALRRPSIRVPSIRMPPIRRSVIRGPARRLATLARWRNPDR